MSTRINHPQHTTTTDVAPATNAPATPPSDVWTVERLRALGLTTTLATASSVIGISRAQAYRLAATGAFPTPLIRVGPRRFTVPVAGLLQLVLADDYPDPAPDPGPLDPSGDPSVDATTTPPADYTAPPLTGPHRAPGRR
jgi:hypothetical protein